MNDPAYEHLLRKAQDAKRGGIDSWSVQSTGEKVAVALVLNRPEWLASMNYSLAEAIGRSESWLHLIPKVARDLEEE
jgi:hypothetical protein